MNYYHIVKENAAKFRGDEKVMWASIESVSDLLEKIKGQHPDLYWSFLRDQHEAMAGHHFNEPYAMWEVEKMHHKGDDGMIYKGEHWPIEATNSVRSKYQTKIPSEYNEWDFYVALNASYHDLCSWAKKKFADRAEEEIIELAIVFWFLDEDWEGKTKVWDYFRK